MNSTTVLVKALRQTTGASFLDCKQALLAHDGDIEQAATFLRKKNLNKAAKKADRQTSEGLIVVKGNVDTVCAVELTCETDFVALTADFKKFTHRLAQLVLSNSALTDAKTVETAVFPETPSHTIHHAIQELIGKLGENIKLGQIARYQAATSTLLHSYVHAGAISGYGPGEGRLGVLVACEFADKTAVSTQTGQAVAHDLALHIASAAPKYVTMADIPADVVAKERERLREEVAAQNKPDAIKEKMVAGRLNKFYQQNCLMVQPFLKDDSITVEEWLADKSKALNTAVSVSKFSRLEIAV